MELEMMSGRNEAPRITALITLAAVILVALWLRLYRIDGTPLYSDQAFCWKVASSHSLTAVVRRSSGDTHPPAYFFLLRIWTAVFGDSVLALRSLSAVLGSGSIIAVYLLAAEAAKANSSWRPECNVAGLVAAALSAIQYIQVEAGRIARMYALGLLLATVSSWLLLCAIRQPTSWRLWIAFVLVAGLFAYTHNYAIFTLIGQCVFAIAVAAHHLRLRHWSQFSLLIRRVAVAGGLIIGLYVPWIPHLAEQKQRVTVDFWISPMTVSRAMESFLSWSTGIGYGDGMIYTPLLGVDASAQRVLVIGILLFVEIGIIACLLRNPFAVLYFVILAATPWACGLATSQVMNQCIVLPRYLLFAHVGFVCLLAVAFAEIKSRSYRAVFTIVIVVPSVYGTWRHFDTFPAGPPAVRQVAQLLHRQYQAGDIVLTSRPKRLLELEYQLAHAGSKQYVIQCPFTLGSQGGHVNLASAINDENIFEPRSLRSPSIRRIWIAQSIADVRFDLSALTLFDNKWRNKSTQLVCAPDDWEEPAWTLSLFVAAQRTHAVEHMEVALGDSALIAVPSGAEDNLPLRRYADSFCSLVNDECRATTGAMQQLTRK